MQRELSLVSSAVSAARMFIAPFADKSGSTASSCTTIPNSFGPWFLSPTQRTASSGSNAAESTVSLDWDDVLSATRIPNLEITPTTSHSSENLLALISAYADDYSTDRPFASDHQVHTLPDVSLQELLLLLNAFSSWVQTGSCRIGDGSRVNKYVGRDLCNSILDLYEAIFGRHWFQQNCMYLMFADDDKNLHQLSIETTFNRKPIKPELHVCNIELLNTFHRRTASVQLHYLWTCHYEAAGWLPALSMDCTEHLIFPAINQILSLISHTCKDVDSPSTFQFLSITSLIMRSGPVALANVAIALLDQLADDSKSPNDISSTVQLMRAITPAYCQDRTLLGALCSVMLASRGRVGMNADVEGSLDSLWSDFDDGGDFMRWSHSSIASKTNIGMLTSRTQHMLNSPASSIPKRIQDLTLSVMAKEWRSLHISYQLRCLRILTRFSARDCPLSSAQWSYLWSLLPETVGFTADDASAAKSCATYANLCQLISSNLIQLCSNFAGYSCVLPPQRPFELPLLDASGQPCAFVATNSHDHRLAVAIGFVQHLHDNTYTSRFALAASGAFDEDDDDHDGTNFRTCVRSRAALFKLCTSVFGPAFVNGVVLPFIQAVNAKSLSSSERFKLDPDQMSNYLFCSCDMLLGCFEAAVTLPLDCRQSVLSACLPFFDAFVLSTEVMQPNVRHFLRSCIRKLSSFSIGIPCMSAAEGVSALKPIWDSLFSTNGFSMQSGVSHLVKRIDFACACVAQLHEHCPSVCLPFLERVLTFSSHSSLAVRASVSSVISRMRLCSCVQRGIPVLLPWASTLYLHFFNALSDRMANPLSRSLDLFYTKATLCNCTLACPSMAVFFPQLCRLLLLTFDDVKSSDPVLASLDLQPGRLLCSVAEVRFDLLPDLFSDIMIVLRECAAHCSRQVSQISCAGRDICETQQIMPTRYIQVRIATSSFSCIILSNMVAILSVEQQTDLVAIPRSLLLDAHVEVRSSAQTVSRCLSYCCWSRRNPLHCRVTLPCRLRICSA